jgi:hypothetical protein
MDFPVALDLGCGAGHIVQELEGHGGIQRLYGLEMAGESRPCTGVVPPPAPPPSRHPLPLVAQRRCCTGTRPSFKSGSKVGGCCG